MKTEVITIDGPTSSGKNSVGFMLAQKLGYQYIDSGSIYRAGCIFILRQQKKLRSKFIIRNNISLDDVDKLVEIYKNLKIEIKLEDHGQRFLANGEDVTDILHNPAITKIVPPVSAIQEVRNTTKLIQYRLASVKNTVMTGRDIGSEIFPDAKFKFFLTASAEVRAQRRYQQLKEKDPAQTYEQVLEDMEQRDKRDSEREASPMRMPKDAVTIDNTNLTVEQTVEEMLKHIHAPA